MTQQPDPTRPTDVVASRVREVRKKRGWSAQRLAEELGRAGLKWDRSIVANLESGRRANVSVEELLTLAYVLDVAPVHLLVPLDGGAYSVTPSWVVLNGSVVREWIRGNSPLPSSNAKNYFGEVPDDEWRSPQWSQADVDKQTEVIEWVRRTRPQGEGD